MELGQHWSKPICISSTFFYKPKVQKFTIFFVGKIDYPNFYSLKVCAKFHVCLTGLQFQDLICADQVVVTNTYEIIFFLEMMSIFQTLNVHIKVLQLVI